MNERCKTQVDANGNAVFDERGIPKLELTADNLVQFDPAKAGFNSLADFLERTDEGKKMSGPTGGIQGWAGTLFGVPYAAGSWQDKLIEAFAGTHDYIGGNLSGLYDEQGSATRGRGTTEAILHDRWSEIAIPLSAPFAAAELLSPEIWKAISILLNSAR
ncbi:hypothetical protein [Thauera linaloolentis]|uniref:hypothetical protein n=1 Tax=Thauera linaloolentis TaxID=76112 RepID=UPI0012B5CC0C|nr:hypothetical protein [Thauera linaloolentis]MCM8566979.1 hypothetical protein [Thauera linaloolentis]